MKQPSSSKYDYSVPEEQKWKLGFAWIPFKVGDDWFWMCDVMKRGLFEYRLPTIKELSDAINDHRSSKNT